MEKRALILSGGWAGHDPEGLTRRFRGILEAAGCCVQIEKSPDCFAERAYLTRFDLFVPVWSGNGTRLPDEYGVNIADAVEGGMGLAGCHGSMCDAFRESVLWQFLTGAQWVAHPGRPFCHCTPVNGSTEEMFMRRYTVRIRDAASPVAAGLADFSVFTEQYYLHVDPSVHVVADTVFSAKEDAGAPYIAEEDIVMPVAYTRRWGKGRVFYNSIGHNDAVFDASPEALALMRNGLLWAVR